SHSRYHLSVVRGYILHGFALGILNGPGEKNNGRRLSHSQLPWPEIQSTNPHAFSVQLMDFPDGIVVFTTCLSLIFTTRSGPPWGWFL
ncbi:hypothetical protein QBC41DRAFT_221485, partial [Cercophora samala]